MVNHTPSSGNMEASGRQPHPFKQLHHNAWG